MKKLKNDKILQKEQARIASIKRMEIRLKKNREFRRHLKNEFGHLLDMEIIDEIMEAAKKIY